MLTRFGCYADPMAALNVVDRSHAEGSLGRATGGWSHCEGGGNVSSGAYAHAEGYSTVASGTASHAEGYITVAAGHYSHAQGRQCSTDKTGQHAQSSMPPVSVAGTRAQLSIYVAAAGVAATAGATADLTFLGDGTINLTGASTSVLIVPLKSLILVRYDIVARPNAAADAAARGASWSGTVLVGRGNANGTPAAYSTAATQALTGTKLVPQTASFDSGAQIGLELRYAVVTAGAATDYLRFWVTNNTGLAYAVTGGLQCVELVTTT